MGQNLMVFCCTKFVYHQAEYSLRSWGLIFIVYLAFSITKQFESVVPFVYPRAFIS